MSETQHKPGSTRNPTTPHISPEDVERNTIRHEGCSDGMYAPGVSFKANGRRYHLLDKNHDGVANFAWSYGAGENWCEDHDAYPEEVLDIVRDALYPLDIELRPGHPMDVFDVDDKEGRL